MFPKSPGGRHCPVLFTGENALRGGYRAPKPGLLAPGLCSAQEAMLSLTQGVSLLTLTANTHAALPTRQALS